MNELIERPRDIGIITAEIKTIKQQTVRLVLCSYIELGRRLTEAKELLPHGEWGRWLQEEAEFGQSTAQNMMRIYEEYGSSQASLFGEVNSQTFGNLTYSKAIALLKVPKEEREDFARQVGAEELSTRELEKLIRERDEERAAHRQTESLLESAEAEKARLEALAAETAESLKQADAKIAEAERLTEQAKKAAADAEKAKAAAEAKVKAAEAQLEKAKKGEATAKDALKALKAKPEIPDEVLEKLKRDAAEAASSALEIEKQLINAKAEAAEAESEALRKKLATASPEVTAFKIHFEAAQEQINKMFTVLENCYARDPEQGEKLKRAAGALAEGIRKRIGGTQVKREE